MSVSLRIFKSNHPSLIVYYDTLNTHYCLNLCGKAKHKVEKPFAFEDELREKTERLNALNIELNLNEKDRSVMDTEPDQSEEQPERKCANRER